MITKPSNNSPSKNLVIPETYTFTGHTKQKLAITLNYLLKLES